MLLISTAVKPSMIEGVGVFATLPIAQGTIVWRFDKTFDLLVPRTTYAQAPNHLRELLDRYAYPSHDWPGLLVYESGNGRFMNHSETPNTDFSSADSGVASRDIATGEELTCDYRQFYDSFEL